MAELSRFCAAHPDRLAIGRCVITQKAICVECSTPYGGVNYSKDGLAQHLAALQKDRRPKRSGATLAVLLTLVAAPAFYSSWQGLRILGDVLIEQLAPLQRGDPG